MKSVKTKVTLRVEDYIYYEAGFSSIIEHESGEFSVILIAHNGAMPVMNMPMFDMLPITVCEAMQNESIEHKPL